MGNWSDGKHTFEFFPVEYVELNVEMAQECHPKLHAAIAQAGATMQDDVDLKLALIAAYCEVMMDDIYTLEDRIKLCKILKEKLILLREDSNPQVIQLLN